MKTLNILVVTRNRVSALIDALMSVKRISALASGIINVEITIQDNSDIATPVSILSYFSKHIHLRYHKTSSVLSMSRNWNEGMMNVVKQKSDYIAVLADRRLVTSNLVNALKELEDQCLPFLCFDHQDVWINAHRILTRDHTYKLKVFTRNDLLAAIASAQINWNYPMLFNCVLTNDWMLELAKRYGSFVEGSSPDINFLARMADIGIETYCTYDAPCIVTNARHAHTSGGTNAAKFGTVHDTEHIRLSGFESYPVYMENFVTANIIGSLARYWSEPQIRTLIDAPKFFRSSLVELSYPKSADAFFAMKKSLIEFSIDFCLGSGAMLLIESIQHAPSHNQQFPIISNPDLSNSPELNLLTTIEGKLR